MKVWQVGLLVLLCVAVFFNSLENGFHLDDSYRVQDNPGVQQFSPALRHFTDPTTSSHLPRLVQYRPLLPLSLSVNYAIAGDSLVGYHLGNLLLHVLASLLVFLLAHELLTNWGGREPVRGTAFFTALLFAVHPVSGIPVNYICARDLILMQVFSLAALFVYARMRRSGDSAWGWGLSLVLLLLALLSKKNAVVFPAIVLLFELLLGSRSMLRLLRALPFVAMVGGLLLFVRYRLGFSDYGNIVDPQGTFEYAAHQLQHHVFHYLRNFAWPFPIRPSPIDDLAVWKMVVGGVVVTGSWVLAAFWWRRRPLLAFCIFAYQAWIALTSSFLPLHDEVVAYRPYAGSVFLFLAIADLLRRWGRAGTIVLAILGLYFAGASVYLNTTWKDERALWEHAVRYGTGARGHYNFAQALPDTDPRKRQNFDRALELGPNYIVGHIGLAMLQIRTGDHDGGLARMEHAISLGPNRAQTHYWQAQAFTFLERYAEAADAAQKALELQPGNVRYRYFAGQRASVAGRFRDVIRVLEPLQARGGYAHTDFLLGFAYFETKNWPKAIERLEAFVTKNPQFKDVHLNLVTCYRSVGDHANADRHQKLHDSKRP